MSAASPSPDRILPNPVVTEYFQAFAEYASHLNVGIRGVIPAERGRPEVQSTEAKRREVLARVSRASEALNLVLSQAEAALPANSGFTGVDVLVAELTGGQKDVSAESVRVLLNIQLPRTDEEFVSLAAPFSSQRRDQVVPVMQLANHLGLALIRFDAKQAAERAKITPKITATAVRPLAKTPEDLWEDLNEKMIGSTDEEKRKKFEEFYKFICEVYGDEANKVFKLSNPAVKTSYAAIQVTSVNAVRAEFHMLDPESKTGEQDVANFLSMTFAMLEKMEGKFSMTPEAFERMKSTFIDHRNCTEEDFRAGVKKALAFKSNKPGGNPLSQEVMNPATLDLFKQATVGPISVTATTGMMAGGPPADPASSTPSAPGPIP